MSQDLDITRIGDQMRTQTVAIVPCYNAGDRVHGVVAGVLRHLDKVFVVDDGCTDGCLEGIADLPFETVRHATNRGKGHAIISGIAHALEDPAVDLICLLDADGQHYPDELPNLIRAFHHHEADLVIGSRVFDGAKVPLRSRFGNKVTVTVTSALVGRRLPDTQSGYRLLSRKFATAIRDTVQGGRYETEMEIIVKAIREGYAIHPEPITTIYETGNASSHFHKIRDSFLIYRRLVATAWRYKSAPARQQNPVE